MTTYIQKPFIVKNYQLTPEVDWLKDRVRNFKYDGRTSIYLTDGSEKFGGILVNTKHFLDGRLDILVRAIHLIEERYNIIWNYCPDKGRNILFEECNES